MKPLRTNRSDIFENKYIIIPVNQNESHWWLCIIDVDAKEICCLDSLSNKYPTEVNAIYKYLDIKYKKFKKTEWSTKYLLGPKQEDGVSCGVYVCMAISEVMLKGVPTAWKDDSAVQSMYTLDELNKFRLFIFKCMTNGMFHTLGWECVTCGEWYGDSPYNESWIHCDLNSCVGWYHDRCAPKDSNGDFECQNVNCLEKDK